VLFAAVHLLASRNQVRRLLELAFDLAAEKKANARESRIDFDIIGVRILAALPVIRLAILTP
jgi:hypothetical protein